MTEWPFEDSPNTAAITTVNILERRLPILLVTHDWDDGGFQFLCGTTNDDKDARIVGLGTIVKLDDTVTELADLPLGWKAWRESPQHSWKREQYEDGAE